MTTSPRFFAATLTVLAETRFVDVRACIIFAFRKFACASMSLKVRSRDRLRVCVGRGVGVRIGESRTVDFIQKSEKPNARWIRIFRVGIGYV